MSLKYTGPSLSMQQAQTMIALIHHPHAPRRHGHHTLRVVELPERRAATAPGANTLQPTSSALHNEHLNVMDCMTSHAHANTRHTSHNKQTQQPTRPANSRTWEGGDHVNSSTQ